MTKTLVEGMLQHQVATYEKVRGMQMLIGTLLTFWSRMPGCLGAFVAIAQIAAEDFFVATDSHTSIDDGITVRCKVAADILVADDRHVAVDEKHVIVLGFAHKEIANGGTPDVDRLTEIAAVGPLTDLLIILDDRGVGRAIITYKDFVHDACRLSLLPEIVHEFDTEVVISGNEDG